MNRPLEWTDSHVAKLKEWWPKYSAAAIAGMFGAEGVVVSRNAVISKVHRIGFALKGKLAGASALGRARRPRRAAPSKLTSNAAQSSPAPFTPRLVDTGPLHLSILDLTDQLCHYECSGGEPADYTFCGHPVQEGFPYCPKHKEICYLPPQKRAPKAIWEAA